MLCFILVLFLSTAAFCQEGRSVSNGLLDCYNSADCNYHGTCNTDNLCDCQPGWTGRFCATSQCERNPCRGNTVCVGPNQCRIANDNSINTTDSANSIGRGNDGRNDGRANGRGNYNNRRCTPEICRNGVCINNNVCQCNAGYGGENCAVPQCPSGCGDNGVCIAPGRCDCFNGWSGRNCATPPRANIRPRCAGGCGNGRCIATNVCQCSAGYGGPQCQTPICNNGCGGSNGACTAPNECTCYNGWSGSDCSISPGGGNIGDGGDDGDDGYGETCVYGCVNGACINGVCRCNTGYGGVACDNAVNVPQQIPGYYGNKQVGDPCFSNEECTTAIKNSYCEKYSQSCKYGGKCMCKKGYVVSDGRCMSPRQLGEDCASTLEMTCVENTYCSVSGTCECSSGYKPGPLNLCAHQTATQQMGEECSSTEECYYDLICSRGTCACPPGRMADSSYSCRALTHGDPCSGERDCAHLSGAVCDEGVCNCKSPASLTTYTDEKGEKKQTCASENVIKREEVCPTTLDAVCQDGYACILCPNNESNAPRCYWPAVKGADPLANQTILASAALSWSRLNNHQIVLVMISDFALALLVAVFNYL